MVRQRSSQRILALSFLRNLQALKPREPSLKVDALDVRILPDDLLEPGTDE